jgi:hypothetical protein
MGLLQLPAAGSATGKRQVFTSSGTFILPSGYSSNNPLWARVTAVGGGGGGGQGYASGGGGGGAVVVRDMAITANIPVVIGAGGISGAESTNGGRGGDTIFGNSNTRPVNLLRNPFQTNLYGGWDTTGWTNTATGNASAFQSDYSPTTNQYLRNKHFMCDDTPNYGGVFKSSYGISVYSTSGDSTYTFYSDYFNTDAAVTHYYGVYTRTGQGGDPITVTLEWYDAAGNQLNTANLATFTYDNTTDNKYSGTPVTSPAGTTRGRLKIALRVTGTNYFSQLFGAYVSQEVDCAWQYAQNSGGYWTGAAYTSYLTRLNAIGFSTSAMGISDLSRHSVGIVAGGGGGGGRATDEGPGGWFQCRFGGPGGHWGGYGSSNGEDSNGSSFTFGGDGGGAGGIASREVFRSQNGTTPFSNDGGFVGVNSSGLWRTFGHRMPTPAQAARPSGGNAGTSPIYLTGISSSQFAKFRVEGSKPHPTGYASGGPGRGYANFSNQESTSRYFYNEGFGHYRELPYGNGGAAYNGIQNRNTTTYGDIDYHTYGDWPRNGDQGIITIDYMS